MKNKLKQTVYALIAVAYVVLFTAYGSGPLNNLLSGLPQKMAIAIFYAIEMLLFIIFVGITMRLSNRDREKW